MKMRFSDFVTLQRGFDLPKTEMREGPYPVFGSTSIIGYHDMFKVPSPGVITGRSGSLGVVQYASENFWPHNTSLWVKDFKGNDPKFVYYRMKEIDFARFNTGAGVPTLNRNHLDSIEIEVPDVETQKRIGSILTAYDDLIFNNFQRIKILESLSREIYREWFINFRFPGYEGCSFVGTKFGLTPEGWAIKSINELINSHIGGGWGEEKPTESFTEPAWVIRGTDIPGSRHFKIDSVPFRYHKKSNLKSRKLEIGDVIFEVSGGSKGQPLGRSLLITSELLQGLNGDVMCASFCKRIEVNTEIYQSELLYLSFLEGYESGEIEQYQVQSTGISNYKWVDYIENTMRVVPPMYLQEKFLSIIRPIFSQIAALGAQAKNLENTRELMQPRLMSGLVALKSE